VVDKIIKTIDRYYVLVRFGISNDETVFLCQDYEISSNVDNALRCRGKTCAEWVLEYYENTECNGESSGFVPLLVTREYAF
jgi:hypothetical protein